MTADARGTRALVPVLLLITTTASITSSLGAPLLAAIARTDHVSLSEAQWSLTITLMTGAVAAPVLGRLGDGPARRAVLRGTLATLAVGCVVAAATSGSFALLLTGRALQGVSIGLMPLTMAVARESLPPSRSAPAIALLSIATVAGAGLGFPLTGLLAAHFGLSAPFWFGAGAALVVLAASLRAVPHGSHLPARPLDLPGTVVLALCLVALITAVSEGQSWGWSSWRVSLLFAAAVALAAAWVSIEGRRDYPLVDLAVVRNAALALILAATLLLAASMYMCIPLITDYVQIPRSSGFGLGQSVTVAGLLLLPFSIISTSMSRAAREVGRRFGDERVVVVGALITVAAMALFAAAGHSLWIAFVDMGVVGIGFGFTFAAIPGLMVQAVPERETGSALGFYQVVRFIGFSLGSAIAQSILAAHTPPGATVPRQSGFTVAFATGASICLTAAAVSALLRRTPAPTPTAAAEADEVATAQIVFD